MLARVGGRSFEMMAAHRWKFREKIPAKKLTAQRLGQRYQDCLRKKLHRLPRQPRQPALRRPRRLGQRQPLAFLPAKARVFGLRRARPKDAIA